MDQFTTHDGGFDEIMKDPTRCYATDCDDENEILLHMADNPWRGADLCMKHARLVAENSPLVLTCDCPFCERARATLLPLPEEG